MQDTQEQETANELYSRLLREVGMTDTTQYPPHVVTGLLMHTHPQSPAFKPDYAKTLTNRYGLKRRPPVFVTPEDVHEYAKEVCKGIIYTMNKVGPDHLRNMSDYFIGNRFEIRPGVESDHFFMALADNSSPERPAHLLIIKDETIVDFARDRKKAVPPRQYGVENGSMPKKKFSMKEIAFIGGIEEACHSMQLTKNGKFAQKSDYLHPGVGSKKASKAYLNDPDEQEAHAMVAEAVESLGLGENMAAGEVLPAPDRASPEEAGRLSPAQRAAKRKAETKAKKSNKR